MKIFRFVSQSPALGALDKISLEGVRGWSSMAKPVRIKVNGQECFRAFCQDQRLDVQAAIGGDSMVGFNAPLSLASGDLVEVFTHNRKPLPGSPLRIGSNTWLAARAVDYPAFQPIAGLLSEVNASHFQPFFRRNAQLAAVALRGNNQPDRLVKLNCSAAHRHDVQAFYQRVITPHSLPAPALLSTPDFHAQECLFYRYIEGRTYSAASLMPEQARSDVIHALDKLHSVSIGGLKRFNKQQSYWVYLQRLVLRQACLSFNIEYLQRIVAMRRCIRKLPRVLSHGDLHVGNVLVGNATEQATEQVMLIDWDRWGELPVGYDEACFLRGLPFQQALGYLPEQRELRLGFTIISFWFGLVQGAQFRNTQQAKEMVHYFEDLL